MNIGEALKRARRRAGLSQRELAERAGLPQSTVARIESNFVDPRTTTVLRLLEVCGEGLEPMPRLGIGIDRSLIRSHLAMSPDERLETLRRAASFVAELRATRTPT